MHKKEKGAIVSLHGIDSNLNERGSFHAKSPKIRKISRVTISDFDENWLKCSSMYMMATCKKVLSSGNKFYFYSHIYTGGVFPIS